MQGVQDTCDEGVFCAKHGGQKVIFVCCVNEWHTEALCTECVPEHSQQHQSKKILQAPLILSLEKVRRDCEFQCSTYCQQLQDLLQRVHSEIEKSAQLVEEDLNLLQLRTWKKSLIEQVESKFQSLENWYNEHFLQIALKERTNSLNELEALLAVEKKEFEQCLNSFSADSQAAVKAIRQTQYKKFQEKIDFYQDKYDDCLQIRVQEQQLEANQDSFKAFKDALADIVWQSDFQEKNTTSKRKKVVRNTTHNCPDCGQEMQYVSAFKKHLVCTQCSKVKRGFGLKTQAPPLNLGKK